MKAEVAVDKFEGIKKDIYSGKKVFWKNKSYVCGVSRSGELCITFVLSGNMVWANDDYNVSDFIVEEK